jgi:hypothetical protein
VTLKLNEEAINDDPECDADLDHWDFPTVDFEFDKDFSYFDECYFSKTAKMKNTTDLAEIVRDKLGYPNWHQRREPEGEMLKLKIFGRLCWGPKQVGFGT